MVFLAGILCGGAAVAGTAGAPAGLRAWPFPTSARLAWDAPLGPVGGYVLYRAEAAGELVAVRRLGPSERETTDYGLAPGRQYRYALAALVPSGGALAESALTPEVETTTLAGGPYMRIPTLDVLCPIYTSGMAEGEAPALQAGLEVARLFYWRNTACRLNLHMSPLLIAARTPPTAGGSYAVIESDLRSRGIADNEYDAVFTTGEGLDGCWGGFVVLGLTGAAYGRSGEAAYPAHDPGVDYGVTWAFTHEFGHVLDLVFAEISGHPEMLFNHFPWIYPLPKGEVLDAGPHYDGMAQVLRRFGAYDAFRPPWDGYIEALDADGDGLPDADDRVPMDEARSGSLPTSADTDADGLSDLAEFTAGIFAGTDPGRADTDGDGLTDGMDPFPLERLAAGIQRVEAPPALDGELDLAWPLLAEGLSCAQHPGLEASLYGGWDDDHLYVAVVTNRPVRAYVSLDASPENGRFQTDAVFPGSGPGVQATQGDCWGDGRQLWAGPGDVTLHVGTSLVEGGRVAWGERGGEHVLEIAIPAELPPGVNLTYAPPGAPKATGLALAPNRTLGLAVTLGEIGSGITWEEFTGKWASFFEPYVYRDLPLTGAATIAAGPSAPEGAAPPRLEFWPVEPNPAAGTARLRFTIPGGAGEARPVELSLFDVRGRLVRVLIARVLAPGDYEVAWNGAGAEETRAPDGVYYARLAAGGEVVTRKILLFR